MLLLLLAIPSADITLKAHDSKSALFYSSADVLASLVRSLIKINSPLQEKQKRSIYGVMSRLIPVPLLACLLQAEGPEKFISAVCSEFMHPEGIWTYDMRAELLRSIEDRLSYHNSVLLKEDIMIDNETEWLDRFNYKCLNEEFLAEGLFVRGLSSTSWEGFVLPPGHAFMDVMQDYLQLNTVNLFVTQAEGVSDIAESYDPDREIEKTIDIQEFHQNHLSENEVEQNESLTDEVEQNEQVSDESEQKEQISGDEVEQKEKLPDEVEQIGDGIPEYEEAVKSITIPAQKSGEL